MPTIFRPAAMSLGIALALAMQALPVRSAHAVPSVCDAVNGNLVTNCGFEGGTYTNTIGFFTNTHVPNGWTPNIWYDLEPPFDFVTGSPANSGSSALAMGNLDNQPAPVLSQILTDSPGGLESGSLFVEYGAGQGSDPLAFLAVQINGTNVLALDDTIQNGYAEYTFSFTGTGSDTLSLSANTNPNEWFVDDVVVTQAVSQAVPEASTVAVLALGLAGMSMVRRRAPARQRH